MSIYGALAPTGKNGLGYGSTAEDVVKDLDLTGKHILLTGCNSGIGFETMRALTSKGATVLGAARSEAKAKKACGQVTGSTIPVVCELSEPESVRACVEHVKGLGVTLDAIVCNAGIMALPKLNQQMGYELQFFTNHIGHFILVTGLTDTLADDGRVVMVSSDAHKAAPSEGVEFDNLSGENGYSAWRAYGQSKLSNLLFARQLAKRFEGTKKTAFALHPGVIHTNLARHMNPLVGIGMALGNITFFKSIPQGAATQTYAAVHPDALQYNGEYLSDCGPGKSSSLGKNSTLAEKLWTTSETIVEEVLPA